MKNHRSSRNLRNFLEMPSLQGKTALVTGANSGIGLPTALELARSGAHVLLACRSLDKAETTAARILRAVPNASVEPVLLDLASLAHIRDFASIFLEQQRTLDLLINNAGVMAFPERRTSVDGFELQFATNHLGHFALTGLLLPALLAASAPRVITVSSIAHRKGSMHFDDLQLERSYTPWKAYRQSKLANLLFALELDRRAKAAHNKLLSIAAHPGVTRTNIVENGMGSGGIKAAVTRFVFSFMQSPEMGALSTLYAATNPSLHGGEFIGPDGLFEMYGQPKLAHPSDNALDQEAARKLWIASEQLTGVTYPALLI